MRSDVKVNPKDGLDQGAVVETAFAKLNLTLEVLRKREDGYHEIVTLMQTVGLEDRLTFTESDRLAVTSSVEWLSGTNNLAHIAARRLAAISGRNDAVSIDIKKGIPVASGMGGGSADAAAVLRGLNRLWNLGMSQLELMEVAAEIGSDVPFLLRGGTALVSGRGDAVEFLPDAELDRVVIVVPPSGPPFYDSRHISKTAGMYQALTPALFTNGSLTRRLAARIRQGGDCHPAFMFNVFQRVAPSMFPKWSELHDALAALGPRDIFITGTGPGFFSMAPTKESGTLWANVIKHRYRCDAFATSAVAGVDVG